MRVRAQLGELLAGMPEREDRGDFGVDLARGGTVVLRRGVEHLDGLARLAEEAGLRLLAERALRDQRRQHRRRAEQQMPRIVGQRVVHRLDDVRHRVQADDVAGAVGRALRAADRRPGQRVDDVERQSVALGVGHRRQHREDADAVGDEVRRVLGADHALAQRRDDEGLEGVEQRRVGVLLRDQLDQVHVPRRVEEVDAAEALAHVGGKRAGELVDRQPRRVGRDHRVRREVRPDLRVQAVLPVHALGDGLDDEVAPGQQREIAIVVGGVDVCDAVLGRQRRRLELRETVDCLADNAVGVALLRGKVEQHDGNVGVGEVRGDLRAHDAGAEDGHFADQQGRLGHG